MIIATWNFSLKPKMKLSLAFLLRDKEVKEQQGF
jgi:hypothetical protein